MKWKVVAIRFRTLEIIEILIHEHDELLLDKEAEALRAGKDGVDCGVLASATSSCARRARPLECPIWYSRSTSQSDILAKCKQDKNGGNCFDEAKLPDFTKKMGVIEGFVFLKRLGNNYLNN